jgi:hypothetical protein
MKCLIVIRSFTEHHHIGRLLEGVHRKTVQDAEIILVERVSERR